MDQAAVHLNWDAFTTTLRIVGAVLSYAVLPVAIWAWRGYKTSYRLDNGGFDEKLRERISLIRAEAHNELREAIAHRDDGMARLEDRIKFLERLTMERITKEKE